MSFAWPRLEVLNYELRSIRRSSFSIREQHREISIGPFSAREVPRRWFQGCRAENELPLPHQHRDPGSPGLAQTGPQTGFGINWEGGQTSNPHIQKSCPTKKSDCSTPSAAATAASELNTESPTHHRPEHHQPHPTRQTIAPQILPSHFISTKWYVPPFYPQPTPASTE